MTPGRLKVHNMAAGEWQYTPGGETVTVKHVVVPIGFADIDTGTGFVPLYLLPENETVIASWATVTESFDGTGGGFTFTSARAAGPGGLAGGQSVGDTFDATTTNADDSGADGLMTWSSSDGPGTGFTQQAMAGTTPIPGGGSVQLVVDLAGGNAPYTQGTTGAMDYHLLIAVAP